MSDRELKFIYKEPERSSHPPFWEWVAYIAGIIAIGCLMYWNGR